jgi:hypothetical protein
MTNIEALQSVIGINYPFDANMFTKALIDASILPGCLTLVASDDYGALNVKTIDLAVAGLIMNVVASPDIAEGGLKLTQADRATLLQLRTTILNKYSLSESTGFIKDASNVW